MTKKVSYLVSSVKQSPPHFSTPSGNHVILNNNIVQLRGGKAIIKKNKRIIATLFLLVLLTVVLTLAASRYYQYEREACFTQLDTYTAQVGRELSRTASRDADYLAQAAGLLAGQDLSDTGAVRRTLAAMGEIETLSRVDLLLPGDMLVTAGKTVDAAGVLSFEKESAAGCHMTRRAADPLDANVPVVYNCAPVVQDGRTAAVLCGAVALADLPAQFGLTSRDEQMQTYLVEQESGNFILDTWHETLGSVAELGMRKTKLGYDFAQFKSDVTAGKSGHVIFYSENAEDYFYASYAPVGVANWTVLLTVPESVAFTHARGMLLFFALLEAVVLLIFAGYFCWMLHDIRISQRAKERELKNVQYMLGVEKELFSAHADASRFVTALDQVAAFVGGETAFLSLSDRVEGGHHFWSNDTAGNLPENTDLHKLFPGLATFLREKKQLLCYDMSVFCRELPGSEPSVNRLGLKSVMAIAIDSVEGETVGLLGVCNIRPGWTTIEPLEQVSLSFSMALNHYAAHRELVRMSRLDTLTGLRNRNSYHAALDAFARGEGALAFGVVYVDANGLHELNNRLGHREGDEMLRTVTRALCDNFPGDELYRIGGDEFVALCPDRQKAELLEQAAGVRRSLKKQGNGYEVSIGVGWSDDAREAEAVVNEAEAAMQHEKQRFYRENGTIRQTHALDKRLEQMLLEKQDADAFLSVLAPEFKGVYIVNLADDSVRHLFIPPYFEGLLTESGNVFSKAIRLYGKRIAKPEYSHLFDHVADYAQLEQELDDNPEFIYQKQNGDWLRLRILKFDDGTEGNRSSLWIFESIPEPEA